MPADPNTDTSTMWYKRVSSFLWYLLKNLPVVSLNTLEYARACSIKFYLG